MVIIVVGKFDFPIRLWTSFLVCGVLLLAGPRGSLAQDVEPRILSPAPAGTNILGLTFAHSWGEVLVDKTLPVKDIDGSTYSLTPSFTRFFGLFGLTSQATVAMPFATGVWDTQVDEDEEVATTSRSGLGDSRIALTILIAGAPAMTPTEFRDYRRKTILGLVFRLNIPTGQYDSTKLINLGSNRWYVVTGLGVSQWWGRFSAEAYGGVWFFTDNTSFLGDKVLSQDPLGAVQVHLSYTFRPRLWVAAGARRTSFGTTAINGVDNDNPANNSRGGLILGFPVHRNFTAKLIASTGFRASTGTDFHTIALQLFYTW